MNLVFKQRYADEAYGLVYETSEGLYQVYEIPQYGGEESYYETYHTLEAAIEAAKSFG